MREHQAAWGVPPQYQQEEPYDIRLESLPLGVLIRDVAAAANWYSEQTQALAAMVAERDAEAIRSWGRAQLAEIGRETSDGDDPDAEGERYADSVMDALLTLADAVSDESDEEEGEVEEAS